MFDLFNQQEHEDSDVLEALGAGDNRKMWESLPNLLKAPKDEYFAQLSSARAFDSLVHICVAFSILMHLKMDSNLLCS